MKNRFLFFPLMLIGLLIGLTSFMQLGGPQIDFKKEVHDYGTIKNVTSHIRDNITNCYLGVKV